MRGLGAKSRTPTGRPTARSADSAVNLPKESHTLPKEIALMPPVVLCFHPAKAPPVPTRNNPPRLPTRSLGWWLIPVLLCGLFHVTILPWTPQFALSNDANYYLGGASGLVHGLGYRIEPYLDLPSVSQYPPLHSTWLALFWRLGGEYPENIPWLTAGMELLSIGFLSALALGLRRAGIPWWLGSLFMVAMGTSVVLFHLTSQALSDLPFALAMAGLFAYIGPTPEIGARRPAWWVGIGIGAGILLLYRSAGLAVPVALGLVWLAAWRTLPWQGAIAFAAPMAGALLIKKLTAGTAGNYGGYFSARFLELGGPHGYLRLVVENVTTHLTGQGWVEALLNVPNRIQFAQFLNGNPGRSVVHALILLTGLSLNGVITLGAWTSRRQVLTQVIIVVAAVYLSVICIWPFDLGTRAIVPLLAPVLVLFWRGFQALPGHQPHWNAALGLFLALNVAGNVAVTRKEADAIRRIGAQDAQDALDAAAWLKPRLHPGEWVAANRDVPILYLRHALGQRLLACMTPEVLPWAFYDIPPALQGNRRATYAVLDRNTPMTYGKTTLTEEITFRRLRICRVPPL